MQAVESGALTQAVRTARLASAAASAFMGEDRLIVATVKGCVDELLESTLSIAGLFQLHEQQIGLTSAAQHHHSVTATIADRGCNAAIKGDGFHGLTWQGNQLGSDLILL